MLRVFPFREEVPNMHRHPWSFHSGILRRAAALIGAALLVVSCGGGGKSAPQTVSLFSISGTITAPAGTVVDSDVNDLEAPFQANNPIAFAQAIPNPASVGGYVNVPGAGTTGGRSTISGDVSDFYRVSLVAGQIVRLDIGNLAGGADLEVFIYDNCAGVPVQSSTQTGATELITVDATGAGNACIEVVANAGGSNYVLSIGLALASAGATGGPDIAHEFVPGEVIVRFRDSALSSGETDSLSLRASTVGLDPVAGAARRAMLMRLGTGEKRARAFRKLGIPEVNADAVFAAANSVAREKWDTLRTIKALRRRADVIYAEPNYIRRAFAAPNDPFYPAQWHYPLINLPQAWDVTGLLGGANVIVAVIDTGVVLSHPDLSGRLIAGYDFISNPASAVDGNGRDNDPNDPGDQANGGSSFHGTHVAGTIAAATQNATGVAGVAGGAKVMPLRVLGKLGGTSMDIIEAIRYAAGLSNASGQLPTRADIINLSLGGSSFSQAEQNAFTDAINQGCIVIAAAGNDNTSVPSYPAAYFGVVSVSAVGPSKLKAPYSNFGPTIDVAAPGGDGTLDVNGDGYPDAVLSTAAQDGSPPALTYALYQGTSMAAPHVAGVAALMVGIRKANGQSLNPGEFDTMLSSGDITTDLNSSDMGRGLIDAHKAVVEAGGTPAPASLAVAPSALNFRTTLTSSLISVSNGGGGALTGVTVTEQVDQPWISVVPETINSDGLGTWRVTIDRAAVPDGTYAATLAVSSSTPNVANVDASVIMQDTTAPVGVTGDAGRHYVLVVDASTGDTVDGVGLNAVNGKYIFSFSGLRAGSYQIYAGTNLAQTTELIDFGQGLEPVLVICGPAEACGAYPTLEQPATLTVNASRSDLDFSTSFDATLGTASLGDTVPAARALLRFPVANPVGLAR